MSDPQRRQQAQPPPPPPRRDREPPTQRAEHRERDWIAANVGKVRYDSLRILELREGATEGKPAKQCPEFTMQTITTHDSLVCLIRKQLNSFNIWTMRTAINECNRYWRKKEIIENEFWFGNTGRRDLPSQSTWLDFWVHFKWTVNYEVSPSDFSTWVQFCVSGKNLSILFVRSLYPIISIVRLRQLTTGFSLSLVMAVPLSAVTMPGHSKPDQTRILHQKICDNVPLIDSKILYIMTPPPLRMLTVWALNRDMYLISPPRLIHVLSQCNIMISLWHDWTVYKVYTKDIIGNERNCIYWIK